LREKPVLWSMLLVVGANLVVFWIAGERRQQRHADTWQVVVFAQSAVGASMIAFGGLNWALDGSAAPVAGGAAARSAPWRPPGD
jgi:hypothetical protein